MWSGGFKAEEILAVESGPACHDGGRCIWWKSITPTLYNASVRKTRLSRKPGPDCSVAWGRGLKGFFLPKMHNLPHATRCWCLALDYHYADRSNGRLFQGPACATASAGPPRARCPRWWQDDHSECGYSRGGCRTHGPESWRSLPPNSQARNTSHSSWLVGECGEILSRSTGWSHGEVGSISVSRKIDLG